MTAADLPEAPTPPAIHRTDLIDALSWAEDMDHGRWGTQYATEVLDAYDARVHADLVAHNADLQSIVDIARASEGWDLALAEIIRLRKQVDDLQYACVEKWGAAVLAAPETNEDRPT